MTHPEELACLETMTIICDTREHDTRKASERYQSFGCPIRQQTLDFGDYTYSFILPNGEELFPAYLDKVYPHVSIERKSGLEELSDNFTKGRDRFSREFTRAKEQGARMYLLIENAVLMDVWHGNYDTRFNRKAYWASLFAWMARYSANVVFCPYKDSAKVIREILYRELKERLERGDYG